MTMVVVVILLLFVVFALLLSLTLASFLVSMSTVSLVWSLFSLRVKDQLLTCPSCYRTTTLPSALLPKHIKLKREAAVLKMKQQASAEATCGSCEEVYTLEAYCHDCSSSICANCVDSHKKLKPLKRHKVVSLQSVRSSQRSITWKLSYCSKHDGEIVRFYCFGCSSLICSECIKYHKEHKWEPLDVAAEAEKAEIKCLIPQMDDSISPITEAIQEVSSVIEDVAVNKDQLKKRITELFDKIAKVVAKRRQELLEEVDKSSLAKTTQLDIQKEGLEKIKNSLQLAIDTMTAACSEYDSVELLSVKYHVQHAAKDCLDESKAVERSPVCASNLAFVADENILKTLSEFAEVKESISTTFDGGFEALVEDNRPFLQFGIEDQLNVEDQPNVEYHYHSQAEELQPVSEELPIERLLSPEIKRSLSPVEMGVDEDRLNVEYHYQSQAEELPLIEPSVSYVSSNFPVDDNLSIGRVHTLSQYPPLCSLIGVNPELPIGVAANCDCLLILQTRNSRGEELEESGASVKAMLKRKRLLQTVESHTCEVRDLDNGKYELLISGSLSLFGTYELQVTVNDFETEGSPYVLKCLDYRRLKHPRHTLPTAVSPEYIDYVGNDFYVSTGQGKIVIYEHSGGEDTWIKKREIPKAKLGGANQLRGIAVDGEKGVLFVASAGANCVIKADLNGNVITTVGDKRSRGTGQLNFNFPTGLCLSKEGLLLVGDCGNQRVQVLGPDMLFIRFIKSRAKVWGVSVDPGGNVHVGTTDCVEVFNMDGMKITEYGQRHLEKAGDIQFPNFQKPSECKYSFVSNCIDEGEIYFYNWTTDTLLHTFEAYDHPLGMRMDQAGRLHICCFEDQKLLSF